MATEMDATHHPHGKNSGHSRGMDNCYRFDATSGLLADRLGPRYATHNQRITIDLAVLCLQYGNGCPG
jgi:hypothetical protein